MLKCVGTARDNFSGRGAQRLRMPEARSHRMYRGCLYAVRQLTRCHGRRERRRVPELASQWNGLILPCEHDEYTYLS